MDNRHKEIMKIFDTGTPRIDNLPFGLRRDRKRLAVLLAEFGMNRGVEIGVRQGDYSKILCEANPNLELSCVDPWNLYAKQTTGRYKSRMLEERQYYENAIKRLKPFNVNIMKMTSMEAVKLFENRSLDFVYIDGNHEFSFVAPDIIYWSEKVKQGGIVACHDYITLFRGGVVEAVNAYTHCNHIDPWYVTRENPPTAFWVKP